jgi:Zn-dependent metalloprotease
VSVSVSASAPTVTATTRAALVAHLPDVRAADGDGFDVFSARTDPAGGNHVRYTRTYHGLPVYGGDVVVHTGGNGSYQGVSNGLQQPMRMSTAPALSGTAALTAARAKFNGFVTGTGGPRLVVDASGGVGQLAWDSLVIGTARDGRTPSRLHVITDARSGAVLRTWDEIETITGTGKSLYSGTVALDTTKAGPVYRLVDPTRGGSTCDLGHRTEGICPVYTDRDDVWGNGNTSDGTTVAADAAYGAAMTFDYYRKVLGRDGIRGDGKGVTSRVHVDDQLDNAFWDREQLTTNTTYVNPQNPSNTARAYSLHAAADLYGTCGTEYKAVRRRGRRWASPGTTRPAEAVIFSVPRTAPEQGGRKSTGRGTSG